jgi:GNAT superfamily N-acetyltransferase
VDIEIREPKNDWEIAQSITLLQGLILEREKAGSIISIGDRTTRWIEGMVAQAMVKEGVLLGAFLPNSSALVGVLLAVDTVLPFSTRFRRVAGGFGTRVLPDFRRQGIAEALYNMAKLMLKERGFDLYLGAVMFNNLPARTVTKKVGFVENEVSLLMEV